MREEVTATYLDKSIRKWEPLRAVNVWYHCHFLKEECYWKLGELPLGGGLWGCYWPWKFSHHGNGAVSQWPLLLAGQMRDSTYMYWAADKLNVRTRNLKCISTVCRVTSTKMFTVTHENKISCPPLYIKASPVPKTVKQNTKRQVRLVIFKTTVNKTEFLYIFHNYNAFKISLWDFFDNSVISWDLKY